MRGVGGNCCRLEPARFWTHLRVFRTGFWWPDSFLRSWSEVFRQVADAGPELVLFAKELHDKPPLQ